jgi:hypothetical protein
MRITDLIDQLTVIRDEHGEVDVVGYDEDRDDDADIVGVEYNTDGTPAALVRFQAPVTGDDN